MTHDELVLKAGWYLRKRIRCYPVLIEPCYGNSSEQPDAIGWRNEYGTYPRSYVIECKANRADFLRDKNKAHRHHAGVGNYRYYMAPAGIIHADEVPDFWGYLELRGKPEKGIAGARVYQVVKPKMRRVPEPGLMDELNLCKGALSNVQLRDRGMQIPESKHQIENLGRGYNQVYRDVSENVARYIFSEIERGYFAATPEEKEILRKAVRNARAGYIPHEGYLRIANL